jgi:hypothetical protein
MHEPPIADPRDTGRHREKNDIKITIAGELQGAILVSNSGIIQARAP